MIELINLTKYYGTLKAVDNININIEDGLIYGFLGVNGAGKSTTLGMMTGCLVPDEGTVIINSYDIQTQPVNAKREIGYLPENLPLYMEMTPEEYLVFTARARGVEKKKIYDEVENVMNKTNIFNVRRRLIRQLSKGYRQRVGLAQALIGQPSIIILDEPTVGLDPEQMVEMRELVRSLRGKHTVIFSSHILSEVSMLCDRVFIIDHGSIIYEGTPENLSNMILEGEEIEITLLSETEKAIQALKTLENVKTVEIIRADDKSSTLRVTGVSGSAVEEDIAFALGCIGAAVLKIHKNSRSLEDAFIHLTNNPGKEEMKK